jgi:recombination protein RecR
MDQSSLKVLQEIADYFNALPGVGKKTALRYALQLIKKDDSFIKDFGNALLTMKERIHECKICHNLSDSDKCNICNSTKRTGEILCIVEDVKDIIAIENTHQFKGRYHVLGGIISPMDGIGPNDLNIESLIQRVENTPELQEVLLALRITMEGDTTNFFISKKLKDFPIKLSTVARGVSFGDQIEFTDEVTLGKSILNRVPYQNSL